MKKNDHVFTYQRHRIIIRDYFSEYNKTLLEDLRSWAMIMIQIHMFLKYWSLMRW
jgi:hypothetical protein